MGDEGAKLKIDFDMIEKLINLVNKTNIGRIKVSINGFEIEVESKSGHNVVSAIASQPQTLNETLIVDGGVDKSVNSNAKIVTAPIVGTFYASPAPNKPAFVKEGDFVKKGSLIYIIESMKLMNEIKSDFSGTVKEIYVKSGDLVEYGQKIMLLE